jgi:hypothetical protein
LQDNLRLGNERRKHMSYVFFAVSAYIFMRAFEVIFSGQKEKRWYRYTLRIIGILVLYTAVAAMLIFYFEKLHLLGFAAG